jgi:hypothetical protein
LALRATFALFAAAIVLIVLGPLALGLTQAALSGAPLDWVAALAWGGNAPFSLVIFAFAAAILFSALLLAVLWLPITVLLESAGLQSWGMYVAAGYVCGGLVLALASGIQWLSPYSFIALLLGGGAIGGLAALTFWLIRRPDWA